MARGALRNYVARERERSKASLIAEPVRSPQFGWMSLDRAGAGLRSARRIRPCGIPCAGPDQDGTRDSGRKIPEREIFDALAKVLGNPQGRRYAITLGYDLRLDMHLVPARRQSISASATPAAITYVHGDSWRPADRHKHLAQLFRLSPQESRLALCLGATEQPRRICLHQSWIERFAPCLFCTRFWPGYEHSTDCRALLHLVRPLAG